jgi:hypothetical protein
VTNLRHEVLPVDDVTRHLVCALDGSRDRADLLEGLMRLVEGHGLVVQRHGRPVTDPARLREALADGLEANLRLLARSALLIEPGGATARSLAFTPARSWNTLATCARTPRPAGSEAGA